MSLLCSLFCYHVIQVESEYHDEESDGEGQHDVIGERSENDDVTPEKLDELAEAAQRATGNLSALGPDLDLAVPKNTPAEGNLLDL